MLLCGTGSVPRNCGIEISKKLFAPRFGLAYRVKDTLVVRAGYGITIDPYEGLEFLRANYPILVALVSTKTLTVSFPRARWRRGYHP